MRKTRENPVTLPTAPAKLYVTALADCVHSFYTYKLVNEYSKLLCQKLRQYQIIKMCPGTELYNSVNLKKKPESSSVLYSVIRKGPWNAIIPDKPERPLKYLTVSARAETQ